MNRLAVQGSTATAYYISSTSAQNCTMEIFSVFTPQLWIALSYRPTIELKYPEQILAEAEIRSLLIRERFYRDVIISVP